MTTKLALTVGINTYPNAPLSGCVNDATDWRDLLQERGYYVATLLDELATKKTILDALRTRVARARWGDRIVFTYSGHGSWVPDGNGDEADGRDEVLCAYDYEDGGLILDDELAEVFAARRAGVRVVVISDSCHSGTVSRFVDPSRLFIEAKKLRYVDPSTFLTRPSQVAAMTKVRALPATTAPRTSAGTVLLSGCSDEEYSYDAFINGRPNGAFTEAAIRTFRREENAANVLPAPRAPRISRWHKEIRQGLPSADYPQSPQLYASLWQRTWTL